MEHLLEYIDIIIFLICGAILFSKMIAAISSLEKSVDALSESIRDMSRENSEQHKEMLVEIRKLRDDTIEMKTGLKAHYKESKE